IKPSWPSIAAPTTAARHSPAGTAHVSSAPTQHLLPRGRRQVGRSLVPVGSLLPDQRTPARARGGQVAHCTVMGVDPHTPIRVLLVDDHAVVRKGMRALLEREPGLEVVGEAEDGTQAVQAAGRLRPDVILMDLEMPGTGGVEAIRQISASRPDSRIVV